MLHLLAFLLFGVVVLKTGACGGGRTDHSTVSNTRTAPDTGSQQSSASGHSCDLCGKTLKSKAALIKHRVGLWKTRIGYLNDELNCRTVPFAKKLLLQLQPCQH